MENTLDAAIEELTKLRAEHGNLHVRWQTPITIYPLSIVVRHPKTKAAFVCVNADPRGER